MTDLRFDGRVALVTGAGGGLGERCAHGLAERGARVLVHDVDVGGATRVASAIVAGGGAAVVSAGRVHDPEVGQAVVDAAVQGLGGVDVVVHVAGGHVPPVPGAEAGPEPATAVDGLYEALWLTRAAWIHMRRRRYGRMVLVSDLGRSIDGTGGEGDGVTGMGLVGLMNVLKLEGSEHGMKVNMVVPTDAGDPDTARDLAVYLGHETCAPTGEIFSAGAEGAVRLFMGVNEGYFDPGLSTDTVAGHLGDILSPEGVIVPHEAGEEIELLLRHVR